MKAVKKLILTLMLICTCLTIYPSIMVKAATLDEAVAGGFQACSVSVPVGEKCQGFEVSILVEIQPEGGTMKKSSILTWFYKGDNKLFAEVACKPVLQELANDYAKGYTKLFGGPFEITSFTNCTVTPSYVKVSETTRHYGYSVYSGFVTATKSTPAALAQGDVEAGFYAGNYTTKYIGSSHRGGQDDYRPMNGVSSEAANLANIIDGYSASDGAHFFATFGQYFPGVTMQSLEAQISGATTQIQVPFMASTLAMSAGHSGGIADVIKGHLNPWSMSYDQGVAYFAKQDGGDSLLVCLANGSGLVTVNSSIPMFSRFVYPFGFSEIPIDSEFIFGVESTPKNNTTKWEEPDSTRQGKFTVNIKAGKPTGIDPNTEYTIQITATPVNAMYDGPFCVATPVTIAEKKVKGSDLVKEKPTFVKFDVTGGSPQNPAKDVLNKGVLQINVTVLGGPTPKQAMYDQTLSDEEGKGSGINGYNYVGWRHAGADIIEENEMDLVPWAQHSASDPLINGTLGANEYNNEDWETGTGIPSTENVYVLAGGETAVSDLAGYFVIYASNGKGNYTEVETTNQGENEPGIGGGTPAVTREINVMCSVQNTWGYDNTLCHRQARDFTGTGGEGPISQGGGNAFECPGGNIVVHSGSHSYPHSGSWNETSNHCIGADILGNQDNIFGWGPCPWHGTRWSGGTGAKAWTHHDDCRCTDSCIPDPGPPASADDRSCGNPMESSCPPSYHEHDCTWKLSVYDGDKNDSVNVGCESSAAYTLPSFTLQVSGWKPLEYESFEIVGYSCNGKDWGAENWKMAVLDIAKGVDCTAWVTGTVTFTPQANQYFHLDGQFVVGNNANGIIERKPTRATSCDTHWYLPPQHYDDGPGGVETVTVDCNNETGMKCNGYSYGTGSKCDEYENCYHLKEHNYTLKYLERIDFYTFRTVTDAHLAAMRGSEIGGVNQVNRSGYSEFNGTYAAPISEQAVGESVTAPESIGYLWRCINSKYGSYINGEGLSTDKGEYNGRILFEIWKEPEAGASGALSYTFNTNFCLGNAEIKAVLQQDHEFGNDTEIYPKQLKPTEALTTLPDSMPNRGTDEDRYNHKYVTSEEKGKCQGAQYFGGEGDCLNKEWQRDTKWEANDDTQMQIYREIIISEQNAIVNYWQGKNKDDNYHANIISDNMCYGGNTNTTQVIGEYYTVDEGIPLFNYLGGTEGRTEIDEDVEGPIYRNHHSTVGSTKEELADFILNYNCPASPSMNEGDHYGYFGFGGEADGGDTPLADTLTGKCVEGTIYEIENGNKGGWIPGSNVIDAYRRKLGSKATYPSAKTMSGITEFQSYLPNSPTPGGDSFAGYWADHNYPAHVSETILGRCNTSTGQSLAWEDLSDFQFDGTNSGTLNQQQYGQSLLMHNLELVDWTPNGFWPTVELSNAYGWLLEVESSFDDVHAKLNENGVYNHHKDIVATGMGLQLSETLRIYDPISAENSYNIGNQYGAWSGDPVMTPDDSDKDQRVTSINKAKNDFAAIGNYVNTNTYLWTWIAPFGNFSSVGGSSGDGSDITTAEVYRNAGNHGYTDEMYIGTWTKTVKINYPFVAKAKFKNKVAEEFFIDELDNVYGSGNSEYMEAEYGPSTLQNFYTSRENPVFKFGNAVGALNTVDLIEGRNMEVVITAYAINDGVQQGDNEAAYGETINSSGNNSDKWCNAASKVELIDLVGQIGNLAIHDTTDFRFSTYFKKQIDDSWLIDGIILNTDEKNPVHILAEPKDILFQNAENKIYKHATLGITDMYAPSGKDFGKGMSGDYGLLPLTPAYITVPEFKTDALRLGYKVFASIETIGNYQASLRPGTKVPTNYDQAQDPSNDTREEYMEIVSEYYLYDFDDGKFYAIDLWSGPQGAKQCIYSGSDRKVRPQSNSEPLYINMDEEFYRRNVSVLEDLISREAYVVNETNGESSVYTAIMSGLEFIGYTGYVKLDTMDLTFCGSDAVQGLEGYHNGGDDLFSDKSTSSQRWHFTAGLTSTTTPTMPIYTDGGHLTATQVENAYNDLRNKHPNSVIVEFQDYIAKGSVWTLKYKGSLMNTDVIKFYSDPNDCPYDEKSHIETEYKGYPVYNPDNGNPYGSQTIDKDSTPLVAYEAYKSNSEDRTIAGTH